MVTDNSSVPNKVRIRANAIARVGGKSEARVLDLYAGTGIMRRSCYRGVKAYQGVDQRFSRPDCIKGNNKVVYKRLVRDREWNIIDMDAYGNPYDLAILVTKELPKGEYQLLFTDGLNLSLKTNSVSKAVLDLIGWGIDEGTHGLIGGDGGWHDEIVEWYFGEFDGEIVDYEYYKHRTRTTNTPRYYRVTFRKG